MLRKYIPEEVRTRTGMEGGGVVQIIFFDFSSIVSESGGPSTSRKNTGARTDDNNSSIYDPAYARVKDPKPALKDPSPGPSNVREIPLNIDQLYAKVGFVNFSVHNSIKRFRLIVHPSAVKGLIVMMFRMEARARRLRVRRFHLPRTSTKRTKADPGALRVGAVPIRRTDI